jgi:hypothetical protein
MGYYSTINGEIKAPSMEILDKILKEAEDLFEGIDALSKTPVGILYGHGKYYDEWTLPFYELCASLGCTGHFERTGEEFGDMERVDISPGKIERRYTFLPDRGHGEIIKVPLAEEIAKKAKSKSRTAAPGASI